MTKAEEFAYILARETTTSGGTDWDPADATMHGKVALRGGGVPS